LRESPDFALNEEKYEIRLVELAGGGPANRNLPQDGKTRITISADDLNCVNPDIMLISGLFSTSIEDIYGILQ